MIQVGTATFNYDYKGRRILKQIANGPTTYYVAPYYEVTVFPDGSSQHTAYLVGAQGVFAAISSADASGNGTAAAAGVPALGTFYVHKNGIDSTMVQTDAAGAVATAIEYLPYGEVQSITGTDSVRSKFAGKELDEETGLYYVHSRYYDPVLARFLTADDRPGGPMQRPDAYNRYAYVLNNPVLNTDPTGHGLFGDVRGWAHATGNFFTHDVKGFFTGDVKHFFTNKITETVITYVVDGALIVGGTAILLTTPFGGPASTLIGSTMLGAGIGGLSYNLTHQNWKTGTVAGNFSWGQYWGNVGIGAMSGFISGGVAAAAGAVVDFAASSGASAWVVGGGCRFAVNVGAGVVGNAVSGFASQLATNRLDHSHNVWHGVTFATALGAVMGGLGSAAGEKIAASLAVKYDPVEQIWDTQPPPPADWDANGDGSAFWRRAGQPFVPATRLTTTFIAAPGVFFTGLDATMTTLEPYVPTWLRDLRQ